MLHKGLLKFNSFFTKYLLCHKLRKEFYIQTNASSKYLIHDMAIRVCPSGDGCTPSGAQYSGVFNEQVSWNILSNGTKTVSYSLAS